MNLGGNTLTEEEWKVAAFIERHLRNCGGSPDLRAIVNHCGLNQKQTLDAIQRLIKLGRIIDIGEGDYRVTRSVLYPKQSPENTDYHVA